MDQVQQLLSNKMVIGAIAAFGFHFYIKKYRPSPLYVTPQIWKYDNIIPTHIFNLVAPVLFGILVIMARNWWYGDQLTSIFEAIRVNVDATGKYSQIDEVIPPLPFGQQAVAPVAGATMQARAYSSW